MRAATAIATAVTDGGHRESLGVDVVTAEDGAGWAALPRGLRARGLAGVWPAISDADAGPKTANAAVLPGAGWQRGRMPGMRSLLSGVPKSAQDLRAPPVRSIVAQPDEGSAGAKLARIVEQLQARAPGGRPVGGGRRGGARPQRPPQGAWRQRWSNNPQEWLDRAIRRRTDVVGLCPLRDAVLRLAGAVRAEDHDEAAEPARRGVSQGSLVEVEPAAAPDPPAPAAGS